jgi:hypothetical protein
VRQPLTPLVGHDTAYSIATRGSEDLRKLILTLGAGAALALGTAGVADGAVSHASHARCGGTYTPACSKPKIAFPTPSAACTTAGGFYKLPTLTFTSVAGIRSITLSLGGPSAVKSITFTGGGPTQYKVQGVKIPTKGLPAGPQHITITVKDIKGKTASTMLRFSVCTAKPVFTG